MPSAGGASPDPPRTEHRSCPTADFNLPTSLPVSCSSVSHRGLQDQMLYLFMSFTGSVLSRTPAPQGRGFGRCPSFFTAEASVPGTWQVNPGAGRGDEQPCEAGSLREPPSGTGVVGWALTPYRASCGALDRAPGRTCPWLSSPDTEGRRGRAAAARRGDGCAGTAAPAGPDRGQSTRPDRTAPISTTLNLASSSLPGDPGIQRRNGLLFRGKLLHRSLALPPERSCTRLSRGG